MMLATRRGDRHVRDVSLGSLIEAQGLGRGSAGTSVSSRTVAGIPAAKEAIRIAAEAVAVRDFGIFRGLDLDRRRISTTWQSRLFGGNTANADGDSWFAVMSALEASLTARNNGFWLKERDDAGQVTGVRTLHPDDLDCRSTNGKVEYRFKVATGGWSEWLPASEILHFRNEHVAPGSTFPPSPLTLHREALRNVLAKTAYESSLYEDGALKSLALLTPEKWTQEQADGWRRVWQSDESNGTGPRVRVIGGGAKLEEIGLSLEDAQYVESVGMSIDELGRVFAVWASLLGGGSASTKPLSPEHEQMRWVQYGLEPRLNRIAATINADPDLFGPAARDYFMFADVRVRADTVSEAAALVQLVQAGIALPDEARAIKGWPPLADGAGQIPQITPVGGAPNPEPPAPVPVDPGVDPEEEA